MVNRRNPLATYQSMQQTMLSGRALEAFVLRKAMAKLAECEVRWDEPDLKSRLAEALQYNQKIWTLFQADWLDKDCTVPNPTRKDLLDLSYFVDRRTSELLIDPVKEKGYPYFVIDVPNLTKGSIV